MAVSALQSAWKRTVVDLRPHGIKSVPMLGRYDYSHANYALEDHSHPGAIEICLLVRGRQTYSVGGEKFHLQGGDIFMTFPDESHGSGGNPEEKGLLYWMTVLDPSQTSGSLIGLSVAQSKVLWRSLTQNSRRHFPGTPDLKKHQDTILRTVRSPQHALSGVTISNHLIGFLLAIVAARSAFLNISDTRFAKVLAYVEAHLAEPEALTVDTLARLAELSTSRFKTRFRQEQGMPPAEFVLRQRIAEARRRLARPDASVTDVAFELGFSSSQYFASSFKRLTNTTPRDFQRSAGGSKVHGADGA